MVKHSANSVWRPAKVGIAKRSAKPKKGKQAASGQKGRARGPGIGTPWSSILIVMISKAKGALGGLLGE